MHIMKFLLFAWQKLQFDDDVKKCGYTGFKS